VNCKILSHFVYSTETNKLKITLRIYMDRMGKDHRSGAFGWTL